ncbi:MAG: hypothetical protein EZS28_023717 [Streblomastix strix]|uniref:Uncharacterized protein n=1 Tax=Streblomastix strix TaxID=222440 RepID=A0A5J4VE25_9EUKA|nr:MAG: hypothetical protein EZS28_023717 [Streblomastix strix]
MLNQKYRKLTQHQNLKLQILNVQVHFAIRGIVQDLVRWYLCVSCHLWCMQSSRLEVLNLLLLDQICAEIYCEPVPPEQQLHKSHDKIFNLLHLRHLQGGSDVSVCHCNLAIAHKYGKIVPIHVSVVSQKFARCSIEISSIAKVRDQCLQILTSYMRYGLHSYFSNGRPIWKGSSMEHPVPAALLAISKQRGGARVFEGVVLQQSPLRASIICLFRKGT